MSAKLDLIGRTDSRRCRPTFVNVPSIKIKML